MSFFLPDTRTQLTTYRQTVSREYIYNPHFVKLMHETIGDTVDPVWSAGVKIEWIGGLPAVMVLEGGKINRYTEPHMALRGKLQQWLPGKLPLYIERLTSMEDPKQVLGSLLESINTQLQAWRRSGSPLITFGCALTWRCPLSNTVKIATVGMGQGILAVYRQQTGQYDIIKPSVSPRDGQDKDLQSGEETYPLFEQVTDVEPGDILVAMTEGAFRWLGVVFDKNGVSTQITAIPPHELRDTNCRNAPEYTDASERGFDASMASAVVPSPEITEQIKADTLQEIRKLVINRLYLRYPDGFRMFGRRHNERREAICNAIRRTDLEGIRSILRNQYELTQNQPITPLAANILDERWSQPHTVRNSFAQDSLYKAAIASTYDSFLKNEERSQEKPAVFW